MKPLPPGDKPGQAGWLNSKDYLQREGVMRYCNGCGELPRKQNNKEEGTVTQTHNIPMKRCSRCHHAWYHDRKCQENHFHAHKLDCLRWSKTIKDEPKLESYPFVEELQEETAADDAKGENLYGRSRKIWATSAEYWETTKMPWVMNRLLYDNIFLPLCFQNDTHKKVDVIMDFGCATGSLTEIMRSHATKRVIAFDISHDMIEWVRAKANRMNWDNDHLEVVEGCLTDIDDPVIRQFREKYQNKVDLIVATMMLPYIPPHQMKATFLAFHDLLKPGTGRLCHIDDSRENPESYFPVYVTHEECETFYKWGQLEKEILKTEQIVISGRGGTMSTKNVIGMAKKK